MAPTLQVYTVDIRLAVIVFQNPKKQWMTAIRRDKWQPTATSLAILPASAAPVVSDRHQIRVLGT